jgi:glycosyltransferase involved in cell wall biosynthesis
VQAAVSVIVAVKNGAAFLADALQSVRGQPGPSIDLIVVDGGSTDGSRAIAARFGARILREATPGLANAWNTGVTQSSAPLVAFLDSDDVWVADTLGRRIAALGAAPRAGIAFGRVKHVVDAGKQLPPGVKREILLNETSSPIPGTMLIRRDVFTQIGHFDPNYAIATDTDWIVRATAAAIVMQPLDLLVLIKRLHQDNLTGQVDRAQQELLSVLRCKIAASRAVAELIAPRHHPMESALARAASFVRERGAPVRWRKP